MATYISRVTFEDHGAYSDLAEAREATDEWAKEVAEQQGCTVHYVEVWPEADDTRNRR